MAISRGTAGVKTPGVKGLEELKPQKGNTNF